MNAKSKKILFLAVILSLLSIVSCGSGEREDSRAGLDPLYMCYGSQCDFFFEDPSMGIPLPPRYEGGIKANDYLNAPTGLNATAESALQIKLTWTDNNDYEQGTRIWRKRITEPAGNYQYVGQVGANITSFTDRTLANGIDPITGEPDLTPLEPGIQYSYYVKAFYSSSSSPMSNLSSATTFAQSTSIPNQPTLNDPVALSANSIRLTWGHSSQPANAELGFKIYRDGGQGQIADLAANVLAFTDGNLSDFTDYCYWIVAYNHSGNRSSETKCTRTLQDSTPPMAPLNLQVASHGYNYINLQWQRNLEGGIEDKFEIWRMAQGESTFTKLGEVLTGIFTYSDTGLTSGTQYSYRVRAVNSHGASGYSNTITHTTGAPQQYTLGFLPVHDGYIDGNFINDTYEYFRVDSCYGTTFSTRGFIRFNVADVNGNPIPVDNLVAAKLYLPRIYGYGSDYIEARKLSVDYLADGEFTSSDFNTPGVSLGNINWDEIVISNISLINSGINAFMLKVEHEGCAYGYTRYYYFKSRENTSGTPILELTFLN